MRRADESRDVSRSAQNLIDRYGPSALRVARDWAEIKESQGGFESAARWRLVADATIEHYRREASRIREHAANVTKANVRQRLLDKARQIEELAEGLENAALEGEEAP
jgi:hypothetical protein